MSLLRFANLSLLSLAFCSTLNAQEVWLGASHVTFRGYSFLHEFSGTIGPVPLKVLVSQGAAGRLVSATSAVEVKQLTTRNRERDRNMMLMFDEPHYPLIQIAVGKTDEKSVKPLGKKSGTMAVTLTIAGRRDTVSAVVTNLSESRDAVSFDLAFPVSLHAFQLNPPETLGGLVKVRDTVDVTAHVQLQRSTE